MLNRSARTHYILPYLILALLLFAMALAGCQQLATANADDYHYSSPGDYYLYVPKDYDPLKTWPLWVHIHGAGGNPRGGCWDKIQKYAEEYNFILLCPSLNAPDNHLYYDLGLSLLNPMISQVRRDYNVSSQIFLSGFSGGGYFVQLFAQDYPGSISGLTIMSSAMYTPSINSTLRSVPIMITVGSLDGNKPYAEAYYQSLQIAGFNAEFEVLNRVGHVFTEGAVEQALRKFREVYPNSPF